MSGWKKAFFGFLQEGNCFCSFDEWKKQENIFEIADSANNLPNKILKRCLFWESCRLKMQIFVF